MSGHYASVLARRESGADVAQRILTWLWPTWNGSNASARMSLAELRFRLAQKLRIGRERMASTWTQNGSLGNHFSWKHPWNASNIADPILRTFLSREDAAAESELAEYLLSRKEPAFYFTEDESEGIARTYRQSFPQRIPQIVEEAERLCAHRMTIFGYPEVSCGAAHPLAKGSYPRQRIGS